MDSNIDSMYKKFKKKALISTTVFNNNYGTAEYGKQNNVYVKSDSFVKNYDKTRKEKKLNGVDIGFFIVKKQFLESFRKKNINYSFENNFLIKAIELKKLIAYKTDRQYFSITNLKMLNKFKKISIKRKLKYIE